MINYDEDRLLDDYAYLAAIPTTVFKFEDKLFSYPLLFYQDEYSVKEDKERSLNARQGLDYFMEDWMGYCYQQLDQINLINVPINKLDQNWNAKEYEIINSNSPYNIANQIALQDWSYSDNVVIVAIEETYERPNIFTSNEISGLISPYQVENKNIEVERPNIGSGATYKSFNITDKNYKFVVARLPWNDRNDYDLELYDDKIGMVSVSAEDFMANYPYQEVAASYIHNYDRWEVSVSAVPMKGPSSEQEGRMESIYYEATSINKEISSSSIRNMLDVDVSLYPGVELKIKPSPFGCRDVDFTLKWKNPGVQLGFTLLDPVGTEIAASFSQEELLNGKFETEDNEVKLHVDKLGECREWENYTVCVFSLGDITSSIDFTLDYCWYQNFSKIEGDCLSSACNGAVLASVLNAPLLYTSLSNLPAVTKDVLSKLGVKNVYLVDLGGHLLKEVEIKINEIAKIKSNYKNQKEIYDAIRGISKNNDIIFSTTDPWSYWYVAENKPAGEYPNALFIGPAAYIAAHHGSPVILVDTHPQLSQAVTYHTDFWIKFCSKRDIEPSSGSMYLTSKLVYSFLEEYGFGKIEKDKNGNVLKSIAQNKEIIITVAGQFDIGITWDRSFTGAALPGRFWGSPVDIAYSICRNVFYPAIIFVNPGTSKVELTNGSSSTTGGLLSRLKDPKGVNLVITKQSGLKDFQYPVLHTYNTYLYRFNEKATKHYENFLYTTVDGITPYITPSNENIDNGAAITKSGKYYPDLSETEVIPFYCSKAGYSNCFSTNFDRVNENLNKGVLIWVDCCHGFYTDGGQISMWNIESPYVYEENPWRVYEPVMIKPGHLRTYIHWLIYYYYNLLNTQNIDIPLLKKISSTKLINFQLFPEVGSTKKPDVSVLNTQLVYVNKLINPLEKLLFFHDLWGSTGIMLYRNNIIHPFKTISENLPFVNWYQGDGKVICSPASGNEIAMKWYNGYAFDDALKNIHSCGINAISCFPALTYLHLTWMRHGASYVIIDPWSTTDWASVWEQNLIKRFALGDTVGEAYEDGMRMAGPEYPVEQWWWDVWEDVELFGDPNLRVFVPGTEYSDNNYWEKKDTKSIKYDVELEIAGHMPFGATIYPNEKNQENLFGYHLWLYGIIGLIIILLISILLINRNKK